MRRDRQSGGDLSPFFFLVYEEEYDGVGTVSVARSIATGHVSIGTSQEHALRCLIGTLKGAIRIAAERGSSLRDWLHSQHADEPEYVLSYARAAAEKGVEILDLDDDRVTMVKTEAA